MNFIIIFLILLGFRDQINKKRKSFQLRSRQVLVESLYNQYITSNTSEETKAKYSTVIE